MFNYIIIMGCLICDPELRRTGNGIAVTSFTVAVGRDFGQKGGEKETDFIDCVAWRQTGEFVSKYFKKGSMIVVSGRLQIRNWNDKDGNKRRTAEVVADNCYFGGSKGESTQGGNAQAGGCGNTGADYSGYAGSAYPETEAMLRSYGAPQYHGNDYAVIEEDDGQLPF